MIAHAFVCAVVASGADFRGVVKTVYVMRMANGLDQYLAARLTSGSMFQVVTDPRKADAVITDHVGETFERSLDELFGSVSASQGSGSDQTFVRVQVGGQRSRGTYFLVARKTRDVLWSDEENPKDNSAKEMRRIASRIAKHLAETTTPHPAR
jgi:hypothetical protein